jgi:hypothetical protein
MVGLDGLEPTTSVLSGPRSSRLSYRPTLWVMAKSHFRIIATDRGTGKQNQETKKPRNQNFSATPQTKRGFAARLAGAVWAVGAIRPPHWAFSAAGWDAANVGASFLS